MIIKSLGGDWRVFVDKTSRTKSDRGRPWASNGNADAMRDRGAKG